MKLEERQQEMRDRWAKRDEIEARRQQIRQLREKWKQTEALFTWDAATHARFMIKVDDESDVECWIWTARLDRDGYGRFSVAGKNRAAHRVAYEAMYGPVPEGLTLDHLCRNRAA